MNKTHSFAAIRAAEIITGKKYGDSGRISTQYGMKSTEGIADLIDRAFKENSVNNAEPQAKAQCNDLLEFIRAISNPGFRIARSENDDGLEVPEALRTALEHVHRIKDSEMDQFVQQLLTETRAKLAQFREGQK